MNELWYNTVMSLENELLRMDEAKASEALEVVFGQVEAQGIRDLITESQEQKYPAFVDMVDEIREKLMQQAEAGLVEPEIAFAIGRGATLLACSLIQYADTENFDQQFPEV
jgi:hypothetical protein